MNLTAQAKNIIEQYCDSLSDPFIAETHRILMEADVQWLNLQVFVIGQMLDNPQVEVFGRENIAGWETLNNNQKIAKLFGYFNESGALKDLRDYAENSVDIKPTKSSMHYDFIEVEEPFNGNESIHLQQLKKSKAFKDITQILLDHV